MHDALKPVTLAGKPDLPPLLLLHGFMGRAEDWRAVADTLGDAHQVMAVNLPGHGPGWTVESTAAMDIDACAADIAAQVRAMGLAPVSIAGYSMGGRVALYLALRHPDVVYRLILESASPGLDSEEKRASRIAGDEALAGALEGMPAGGEAFRAFLHEWYEMPLFASIQRHPEELERLIAARLAGCAPALLAASLRALGTGAQPNLWPELPHLAAPTLLLAGEEDRKFRIIAEDMARACPAMAAEVLTGCGHNVHLEQLESYCTVVRAFLHPQM